MWLVHYIFKKIKNLTQVGKHLADVCVTSLHLLPLNVAESSHALDIGVLAVNRNSLTNRGIACLHARMVATAKLPKHHLAPKKASGLADKEPLQVRIPIRVKRAFKSAAALRGMEPNELFVEVWHHYEQTRLIEADKGTKK